MDLEDILMDEKKVTEAQAKIDKAHIIESVTKMAEALEEDNITTDFDELD